MVSDVYWQTVRETATNDVRLIVGNEPAIYAESVELARQNPAKFASDLKKCVAEQIEDLIAKADEVGPFAAELARNLRDFVAVIDADAIVEELRE